jgi:AcrR family transcriptional regulator
MARGKPREEAILSSTIELLKSVGYVALTMDGVAAHARASKATLYRRWRGKPELVKAALDSVDAARCQVVPDTGALRSDLIATMAALREQASAPYVAMMQDLVHAARHDTALERLLHQHAETEELSPFSLVLNRAVERKQLPRSAPRALVHDVAEAMILRQLQLGAPFDRAFIVRVVDEVLLPLLRGKRSRA